MPFVAVTIVQNYLLLCFPLCFRLEIWPLDANIWDFLRATNLTIKTLSDNGVILLHLHYSALFPWNESSNQSCVLCAKLEALTPQHNTLHAGNSWTENKKMLFSSPSSPFHTALNPSCLALALFILSQHFSVFLPSVHLTLIPPGGFCLFLSFLLLECPWLRLHRPDNGILFNRETNF